ncbi:MAG TPA: serine hydrolase [Gemmatimonadales bacterium]|nr:serine hydrolase [Gemmatimonadales bacterium]
MTERTRRRQGVAALLLLLVLGAPVAAQRPARPPAQLRGFDAWVERTLAQWGVPGLAVAVVKDDAVVYARGFGVRRLGDTARVTDRTLFAVGSTTKAFTAAALAMLVDSGLVRWDDPVARYLPGFELQDPYVTRELRVRDLLTHRSGLPRGDAIWWGTGHGRDEVLRRVRHLEPATSFRSAYGYQNIMFLAAGQIIPAVTGQSWDQFVRRRIFEPLGMAATNTSVTALDSGGDVATPHSPVYGRMQPVAWRDLDNIGPAGSINSSVRDMAQWLRLQLAGGVYGGRRLISAAAMNEMHAAQTVIPVDTLSERLWPSTHFRAYGLGWALQDYRGRKLVGHGGAIDGMRAQVTLVPEERLGVVALANGGEPSRLLTQAVAFQVIDRYLGGSATDWGATLLAVRLELAARDSARRAEREARRMPDTRPTLALDRYAATYRSEVYGDLVVTVEDGGLAIRFGPNFAGRLEHWHFDTFRPRWRDPMMSDDLVTFTLGPDGAVARLEWAEVGEFRRLAEPAR